MSRSLELVGRLRRPWLTPLVHRYARLGDLGVHHGSNSAAGLVLAALAGGSYALPVR